MPRWEANEPGASCRELLWVLSRTEDTAAKGSYVKAGAKVYWVSYEDPEQLIRLPAEAQRRVSGPGVVGPPARMARSRFK